MILDGKVIAQTIQEEISKKIHDVGSGIRPPGLAFILLGKHPASHAYIRMKKKRCQEVGIQSFDHELPESTSQEMLLALIDQLNHDQKVDGILIQLPLPAHINSSTVLYAIDPTKDVDGFHPLNLGRLMLGDESGFWPCTPFGVIEILRRSGLSLEGKHAVVIGRSNIVGKPLATMLSQNKPGLNATVTLAHSRTINLTTICQQADLLIAAIGHPSIIRGPMVKKGAIVIDVGINRLQNGKIVGDVAFDEVSPIASYMTPVPGGVGPMTIAMLLHNTWISYAKRRQK